jgi:hypothetical protein
LLKNLLRMHQAGFDARLSQLQERLFGARQDFFRRLFA